MTEQQRQRPKVLPRERTAILGSLSAGVVPRIGLHHIQVGRRDEIKAMLADLGRIEEGGAAIRFVIGRFGAGKSFFLNLVRTVALERRMIVAQADITTQRRLHASKGEARSLFSELMRNVATRSRPDGGALSGLVERWVGDVVQKVRQAGGSESDVPAALAELCHPLQELVSGFDFVHVLGQYYKGFLEHDEALQSAALRWLRGEYTTKTEAREELGVRAIIDDTSFYDYLKLFAAFSRIAGYAGLLVCLDELVVLSHRLNNRTARNNNYEAILRIVNDCLQGSAEHLGFIFAATDDCMYDKRRGLFSYEALESRLASNRFATEGLVDLSGPTLELKTLTAEDCFVLLSNVRRIHMSDGAVDYALPDEAIEAYLRSCQERMGAAYFQTPREIVKDFIGLLNILAQNPGASWDELLRGVHTTVGQVRDPAEIDAEGSDDDDGLASFRL